MTKSKWTVAACSTLVWAGTVLAAPTPQQKCDRARVTAWRKFVSCSENVVAKEAGGVPISRFEAFAKCRHKYFSKWARYQRPAYSGSSCIGSRFTDNGDGTVTDNLSALVWEKKVNLDSITNLADPHDADNEYSWSADVSYQENGTAFSSFLETLNSGGGFGGANGWRLPTVAEIQASLPDFPCTLLTCICTIPCIDPALDASNTHVDFYWSATNHVPGPLNANAWAVRAGGMVDYDVKDNDNYVRAVRGGL